MRAYGALPTEVDIAHPADTVQTLLIAGSSGQAMGWQTSAASTATNARVAEAHTVRFTGVSTAGALLNFMVNLVSTHAGAPASGSSHTTGTTAGSTGNNIPVLGTRTFQVPAWSTGFSVAALSSGYVMAEVWKK